MRADVSPDIVVPKAPKVSQTAGITTFGTNGTTGTGGTDGSGGAYEADNAALQAPVPLDNAPPLSGWRKRMSPPLPQ